MANYTLNQRGFNSIQYLGQGQVYLYSTFPNSLNNVNREPMKRRQYGRKMLRINNLKKVISDVMVCNAIYICITGEHFLTHSTGQIVIKADP